jgi:rhomboid protease GluP
MLNNPPPKRPHPLEDRPEPPAPPNPEAQEQPPQRPQIALRIPVVRPNVTYVLLAVNVIVFAIGLLSPQMGATFFREGASRPMDVLIQGEYYRLLTAMFLHAGLLHILFNAYALYIIGSSIEPLFGHVRFAIIYILGGLSGSVLSVALGDLSANVGSVGASGAVFALFGAEMVYLYRHRKLLGERANVQLRSLLMLLAVNFFIGIASTAPGASVRIDNWAHLGGLVGGVILTWLIGPYFALKRHPVVTDALAAEDVNPLESKYWAVSLFLIALVGILAVVTLLVR